MAVNEGAWRQGLPDQHMSSTKSGTTQQASKQARGVHTHCCGANVPRGDAQRFSNTATPASVESMQAKHKHTPKPQHPVTAICTMM